MNRELENLPLVVTRGAVILPGVISHFDLEREQNIKAVEIAMLKDSRVFLLAQKDPMEDEIPTDSDELYSVGSIVNIRQILKMSSGLIRVLAEGEQRGWISQIYDTGKFLRSDVWLDDEHEGEDRARTEENLREAMSRMLLEALMEYGTLNQKAGKVLLRQLDASSPLEEIIRVVSDTLPFDFEEKQKLLEAETLTEAYEILQTYILKETNVIRLKAELQQKVQEKVEQNQKDYFLREQMKVIREELGDDNADKEMEELEAQAEALQLVTVVGAIARLQVRRAADAVFPLQDDVHRVFLLVLVVDAEVFVLLRLLLIDLDVLHREVRQVLEHNLVLALEEVGTVERQIVYLLAVDKDLAIVLQFHTGQLFDESVEHRAFGHVEGVGIEYQRIAAPHHFYFRGLHHHLTY